MNKFLALILLVSATQAQGAKCKESLPGTWLFNLKLETGATSHGAITFHEDGTTISHDSVALLQPTYAADPGAYVSIAQGFWKEVCCTKEYKAVLTNVISHRTTDLLSSYPALRSKCEVQITVSGTSAFGTLVQTFYALEDIKLSTTLGTFRANITAEKLRN